MAKKEPNICPNCSGRFNNRTKDGKCPECGIALNLVRDKQGQRSVLKYVLAETPPPPNVPDAPPTQTTLAYGVQISKLDEKHWRVVYRSKIERCVCPNCLKLQLNILQIADGHKFERKCDRCGHYTVYEFQLLSREGNSNVHHLQQLRDTVLDAEEQS